MTTAPVAKDRNIAALGTLLLHGIVIFLMIMLLKDCGGGGGGNGGNGNGFMALELAGIGLPEDGLGENQSASQESPAQPEVKQETPAVTDDNSEEPSPTVDTKKPNVTPPKNPKPVQPVEKPKPTVSTGLNDALNNLNKGQGNTTGNGQQGDPNGQIQGKGAVNGSGGSPGTGGGTGGGNGTGNGPGNGGGSGLGSDYSLAGRNMKSKPFLDEKPKEEGKVVVDVWVNPDGTVVKAEANPALSNTTSSSLYALAVKAAKSARFSSSPNNGQQKGTITIFFKLK